MDFRIDSFFGFANKPEPQDVRDGVVVDGLNWMFNGSLRSKNGGVGKIELRRGYKKLGSDAGSGKVTGLRVGRKNDGTETLFRTRARKIEYYDTATEDWIEVGTNSLPADANGEDAAIESYESLAGSSIYFSSRNSSIYKIMLANPGSLIDMSSTSFRGKMKIKNNRMILWDRLGTNRQKDITGVYGSKLDKDSYGDFTSVSAEAIGASGSQNYTGTLAFKAAGTKRSCFAVKFTDGTQNLYDDFNGGFTGDGTGTINYATGAYNITFSAVTGGAVTADYQWEDPTSGGIADFAYSATRVAGEGFNVRQDDGGGPMRNIGHYGGDYYCFHTKKAWKLSISTDDATAANLPYRESVGIPNWRALAETADGIFYVDDTTGKAEEVKVRYLTLEELTAQVRPKDISDLIDFSGYRFDMAAMIEWGDFIGLACRTSDNAQNNRLFLYDRKLKMWSPPHDLQVYTLEVYNGALEAGDSTTANVYEIYSGFDDDGATILNYATFNISKVGLSGLKKAKRIFVEGEIQIDQTLKVYASYDRGEFVLIDTISGNGDYVDIGSDIGIGQTTMGSKEVGTGTLATANHYRKETRIDSDKFKEIQFKFVATGLGYVSITAFGIPDLRDKGQKELEKYQS